VTAPTRSFRVFALILLGQSLAMLGATVTDFALGIWAYETAGNVTNYTMIAVASTLPALFAGPFVGVWVDRLPRKKALLIAQTGNALAILTLALMYVGDLLSVTSILLVVPFTAVFSLFLQVGFSASVALMVPPDRLNQANALIGLVFGIVQLAGPLLGGIAMDRVGLDNILIATVAGFVIALLSLMFSPIPDPGGREPRQAPSVWREISEAYQYLRGRPGLLGGLWMFTAIWFCVSIIQVLFVPVVLGFGSKTDLGMIQTTAGLGLLVGGILMVAWKGPQRLTLGIALPCLIIATCFIVVPLTTTVWLMAVASMIAMSTVPMASAASQTLWQRKIDAAFQGRVFALRNIIMKAAQPLAFLSAGILADRVFEPGMQEGGMLASWFGAWWGTGEGRGSALLMSASGVVSLVCVIWILCIPRIRRADIDLSDDGLRDLNNGQPPLTAKTASPDPSQ
jgi:DHA3 family macrolide efflux protein-like MFS transporter